MNNKPIDTTKCTWELRDSSNNTVDKAYSNDPPYIHYNNGGFRSQAPQIGNNGAVSNSSATFTFLADQRVNSLITSLRNNVTYRLNLRLVPKNVTDKITIEKLYMTAGPIP